jgi:FlaA1/EpsC-like NDP-sugar epimerase
MLNIKRKKGDSTLFSGKRILVTGGTGSLGRAIVKRLLTGEMGRPNKIIVFSRDEGKHHQMKLDFKHRAVGTDDIFYNNFEETLDFRVGDVRDYHAVLRVVQEANVVIHAAALKQVPSCEYFPNEAVLTNVLGAQNIVSAIRQGMTKVTLAIAVSTDKACKPINVMGMTKALQERIFVEANLGSRSTIFACVRYGNVVASRGSVVPLFAEQIRVGGPITLTIPGMTRFLITLDGAVNTVFDAARWAKAGDTFVPRLPSATVETIAKAMIGSRTIKTKIIGIRPGEKIHEIMVSEDEAFRTQSYRGYYVIRPTLPELRKQEAMEPTLHDEYSSEHSVVSLNETRAILKSAGYAV